METFDKQDSFGENSLVYEAVGACLEVHKELKWALIEKAYQKALAHVLRQKGHKVIEEAPVKFRYKGELIPNGFRVDLLVDDQLIIELKATDEIKPEHHAQLQTYMLLSNIPMAYLLTFILKSLLTDFSERA